MTVGERDVWIGTGAKQVEVTASEQVDPVCAWRRKKEEPTLPQKSKSAKHGDRGEIREGIEDKGW